ncbi:MAG: efflux RND transporter periplasmic adaptor subunit [Armatimonadetes bacterium]|nr:efflux RND transporter periplasmic adaptor subunit [Armatimonadota bacterium]
MNRRWLWASALGVGLVGVVWWMLNGTSKGQEVEYKYAPVETGELLRSTSSSGTLVALTQVDIKSKAGGEVVKLYVEEGNFVHKGDKIAEIDPRDTKAAYDQASADMTSAQTRVATAETNASIESRNLVTGVQDAERRLDQAKIALARAKEDAKAQPTIYDAERKGAEANLRTQQEALRQLTEIDTPQRREDARVALNKARVDLDNANSNLSRQQKLVEQGYAALNTLEQAKSSVASAQAAFATARQRQKTLEAAISSEVAAQQARVRQAQQALRSTDANGKSVFQAEQAVLDAQKALDGSRVALTQARDKELTVKARQIDIQNAKASAVRSRVSLDNAKVQLDSTTVLAPRDGVVTLKYLEEGTIIPPGTSTFSQGTSLVQLSDVTRLFIECSVDEADIASVREDQDVNVVVEAYPGKKFPAKVRKIFPAAVTANAITAIKVRVELTALDEVDQTKTPLRPGMNATCEFIQLAKKDVLLLPQQAVKQDAQGSYVLIKSKDPLKPERRAVKVGEHGNDVVEVLEGVKAGEEVVVAEINLADLRDRQKKIEQAQQGGGFGSQRQGGPSTSRGGAQATGGGAGGNRAGGAGGGGGGARAGGGSR